MTTADQERYAFMHLSLIDMERVMCSLELLPNIRDDHVRAALIRDAIISYAKPFSRNRGAISFSLSLRDDLVPDALALEHKEIRALRDQLVAHNDLTWQKVQFGPGVSFSVTGYERIFVDHLLPSLNALSSAVHSGVMRKMREIENNDL